jgi:hypothetical protein
MMQLKNRKYILPQSLSLSIKSINRDVSVSSRRGKREGGEREREYGIGSGLGMFALATVRAAVAKDRALNSRNGRNGQTSMKVKQKLFNKHNRSKYHSSL